tara:strand:+ start:541 stop:789 length:249 start_codon:yes stop_codon:yes gene_type:complete
MRQPDKYIDNKTIALLTEHPGWKHLKNLFMDRLDAEMESIVRSPLHDTESLAKHNVRIGRIQAWEEILKYPEQATNKPTSTG